jgi:hypothetical protein
MKCVKDHACSETTQTDIQTTRHYAAKLGGSPLPQLIFLTPALRLGARIQGQRTKNTSIQDYNNPMTTHQDPSSEFFSKEKNLEKAWGCRVHTLKEDFQIFLQETLRLLSQIARGSRAILSECNCTHFRERT